MNDYFRIILATIISILATWGLIPYLKRKKYGQQVREFGNQSHLVKSGTPTMGGIAFTIVFVFIILLTVDFNVNILFILLTTIFYGAIGFIDDFEKIAKKQSLGLNEKQKLVLQTGVAFVLVLIQYFVLDVNLGNLDLPFINSYIYVGVLAIPILMFIIVGTVNATNFTDGLDGLLSSVSIPIFIGIYILSYKTNPQVASSALIFAGVLLGFLVFNSYPATIFMGDTGSMAIGGAIVSMLIVLNKPFYLIILGAIFIVEVLSVIIQRFTYKKMNKLRLFLMAPIHHHFELKGYSETKIVSSFMVISIILTVLTLWVA